MARFEFWFDFASTYSYLSAMRIGDLAADAGVDVVWMPFLLGPIFADQGWNTSPFNIYEAKGKYMWRDMERLAGERNIPFKKPETFPQFTLLGARVGVAGAGEPWLAGYCRALFRAEYGDGGDITSRDAVAAALEGSGASSAEWIEKAHGSETKQALKDRVERARNLDIFGAPTFVASDGELFWGDDRLNQALEWTARQ